MIASLHTIVRVLGGEIVGGQALVPGPTHGPRDRSLSIKLSATAPLGFICYSFAGDPFDVCQAFVAERLGLDPGAWKHDRRDSPKARPKVEAPVAPADGDAERIAAATSLWRASIDPRSTHAETYLRSRGLEQVADVANEVIRFHPGLNAMIALFRNIATGQPQAVSRTYLDQDARKLERKFLGPTRGAAVMLDPFDAVTHGLHIGEGIETCVAARALGLCPTWAVGSAGAIAAFPVLSGVEALSVIVDHDPNGAGEKAARAVEAQWLVAGREVNLLQSDAPGDFNDVLRGVAS